MIRRPRVHPLAVLIAFALVPVVAGAQPSEIAPPATYSPLDPVRLAADFAPMDPVAPEVAPFEPAAADSGLSPADPVASSPDSLPSASPGTPGPPFAPRPAVGVEQPSILAPVIGSLIAGAVGLYGGAVLGASIGDDGNEYGAYGGALLGGVVGEVFLLPVGAHLGNGGRGSYGDALGGSALGFVATLALSFAGPVGTVAGVALQTALTVAFERRAARLGALERAAAGEGDEASSP